MGQKVQNRKAKLSPIDRVVAAFAGPDGKGGKERAALVMGVTVWAIDKMRRPVARGGGGGLIHGRRHAAILKASAEQGRGLSPADLVGEAY